MKVENIQAAIAAAAVPKPFVCSIQECYGSFTVRISREGGLGSRQVMPYDWNTVEENAELIRDAVRQWVKTERAPDLVGGDWWGD